MNAFTTIAAFLRALLLLTLAVLVLGASAVNAQVEPDLDVSTPAVVLLKKSMANRFIQLKPHLDAGVVGLTHDGVIALRDAATVELKALLALDTLIVAENKDRATLYREIARANGRPEWESNLRATFGQRWISRMPPGWFYRDEKGQWLKKEQK